MAYRQRICNRLYFRAAHLIWRARDEEKEFRSEQTKPFGAVAYTAAGGLGLGANVGR